ncbi:3-hydroxyacyl-ACP dehydratase FabZ [Fastidiosibacter lacustris]|uniref:3-hydroxyacyl-ACP dehydratase FabZ n=1 Tax=Fastidiosibacter lacustris TaxID=2056695 RepID=UPI000E350874|nr:3-hydroxyacyl-ACP dehydratase FabZ [Fastidiosibacter lacustris]
MQLNIQQIKEILPHRYPFLLVDKIIDMDIGTGTVVAQKNVTANEEFFNGHFPNQPIMPGVLIVEAMAQAIGILGVKMMVSNQEQLDHKKLFVLAGIDNVRIKRPVVPGDVLKLHASIGKIKRGMCKSHAEAYVDNELVASADFIAAYREV